MMKPRTRILLVLAAMAAMAVAGFLILAWPEPVPQAAMHPPASAGPVPRGNPPDPPQISAPARPSEPATPPESTSPSLSLAPITDKPKGQPQPAQPATQKKQGKDPAKDPLARVALAYVGADPQADAYWHEAINDPNLSAQERQDLIEDLNEDGLSDPKQPTLEDLPLILSRLELIEELAPAAMDKVNADAFAEAYKDLVNLADRTVGRTGPGR